MNKRKPFCTVPFAQAFSGSKSAFRNCCVASPDIKSLPNQTFTEWQNDPRFVQFKENMYTDKWPAECHRCQHQEEQSGNSFRTAVNSSVTIDKNFGAWPSRWNLKFGNICNLACWTCDEESSSTIMQHKKTIGILPVDTVDTNLMFDQQWPELLQDVLKSYDYHNIVTLTLLGGEPLYNKTIDNFLNHLVDRGIAHRTRLEFHTNGTKVNQKLFVKDTWNYVCVFLSLDAVGKKAEWLRHGCRWEDIESNLNFLKSASNYTEIHCTLSILNIHDLPELSRFCKSVDLPLKIMLLEKPAFMSILKWSGDKNQITDHKYLTENGFEYYYNLIGTNPDDNSAQQLEKYINQFNTIRKPLADYDSRLFNAIKNATSVP